MIIYQSEQSGTGRSLIELIKLMSAMLLRGIDQQYFLYFNNFLTAYLTCVQALIHSANHLAHKDNV